MDVLQELVKQFNKQGENPAMPHRALVFWYDTKSDDRNKEEIRNLLEQQGIKVWEVNEQNAFQTKVLLEVEDPHSSYLLYAPFSKPADVDNNLLDLLLYAGEYGEFQADEVAVTMKDLGLDHLAIRSLVETYWSFFNEKRRKEKFRKFLPIEVTEEQVKLAMLAVLTGAATIHVPDIARSVIAQGLHKESNEAIQKVEKLFDLSFFYEVTESYFGVQLNRGDRLENLVYTVIYNHFLMEIDFELPASFDHQYPSNLPNTCRVFLDDWFQSKDYRELDALLQSIEIEWRISDILTDQPYSTFERCDTFPIIDNMLIDSLLQQLLNDTAVVSEWRGIIAQRRLKHWYKRESFYLSYDLMSEGLKVYEWQERLKLVNEPRNSEEWVKSYSESYYRIDQDYRKFMTAHQRSNHMDAFDPLIKKITNWYENEYLTLMAWITEQVLSEELAGKWPIYNVLKQKDFYRTLIRPLIEGTKERIFVIISDALRYEVGEELNEEFQLHLNSETSLIPMQASVPSYTQLGMASLLPGKVSGIKEDGTVEVNGHTTRGLTNREKILQQHEIDSSAFQLTDFLNLNKEEGLQAVKGKRVIYLYHDRIDATGDSGKSESYTFEAVEHAMNDLKKTVKKLIGTYAASRIFITSDHGFLFQSGVESHNKTVTVKGEIFDSNRRFAIGRNLIVPEGARKVSLDYLGLDVEAVIAKGLNRFKSSGGLRFVHGGALPQETIVPVIEYRQIKGKERKKLRIVFQFKLLLVIKLSQTIVLKLLYSRKIKCLIHYTHVLFVLLFIGVMSVYQMKLQLHLIRKVKL